MADPGSGRIALNKLLNTLSKLYATIWLNKFIIMYMNLVNINQTHPENYKIISFNSTHYQNLHAALWLVISGHKIW